MNNKFNAITHENRWLKDFVPEEPVQHFAPEQMIECEACRRTNPPTRLACFYCGTELEISEKNAELVRLNLRKLESWEKGFNVVNVSQPLLDIDEPDLGETATFLRLEKDVLNQILKSRTILPLARAEKMKEAEFIVERLEKKGLKTAIVSDEELFLNEPPRKVRAAEFENDAAILIFSGSDEIAQIEWQDFRLFVTGIIFENRCETTARRKRGESITGGGASEFSSDEQVLDVYAEKASHSFRISARSFDFSCLGAQKSLLANENFKLLVNELRRGAPEAVFNENYRILRAFLNVVWEIEERKESAGWKHEGIGKLSTNSILRISNVEQFTRFSRMLASFSNEQA